jgi:hypothetical protein
VEDGLALTADLQAQGQQQSLAVAGNAGVRDFGCQAHTEPRAVTCSPGAMGKHTDAIVADQVAVQTQLDQAIEVRWPTYSAQFGILKLKEIQYSFPILYRRDGEWMRDRSGLTQLTG